MPPVIHTLAQSLIVILGVLIGAVEAWNHSCLAPGVPGWCIHIDQGVIGFLTSSLVFLGVLVKSPVQK